MWHRSRPSRSAAHPAAGPLRPAADSAPPRPVVRFPRPAAAVAASGLVGALLALLAGCGALSPRTDDARPGPPGQRAVITVPGDAPTIQRAVDAAVPGDLVLVGPGVYRESVVVTTPRIVVRGADRNRVVIDGEGERATGVTVTAPEVAVENLTVRGHRARGVAFRGTPERPLAGYRVSYLTAHDNGEHGLSARHARRGTVEHALFAGFSGAGVHIEHCHACRTVVRESVVSTGGEPVVLVAADGVAVESAATPEAAPVDLGLTGQPVLPGDPSAAPRPAVTAPTLSGGAPA
ncbi:right-handed parallel beta-helix repeat-containing protein [Streptomyces bohaiensis]|uniref:right-handed parallel beta-helix repeat-containing protein n=1 Tax=Streptomyces bohaiensis TaxID=1431344 RepID=UPI003B809122